MATAVVGIAGGTGSGKTTFARTLAEVLAGGKVSLLHQDSYYRDMTSLDIASRNRINFDHPDAIDIKLLCSHLEILKSGRGVAMPVYDFTAHCRTTETVNIPPSDVVVVEGIHVLCQAEIRDRVDVKVFIDVDADIRLIRRLLRDTAERGRTMEVVIEQYLATVKPMHAAFIEQSKSYADIIISQADTCQFAVDMISLKIKSILNSG